MGITLVWETAKMFMTLTAGLYAVLGLILLIYLPFCIAECVRQRRGVGRWASGKQSIAGAIRNPEATARIPTAVSLPR